MLEKALCKIELNKKRGEKKLDISGFGLTEIPNEVFELIHLEVLILGNWISDERNKISHISNKITNLSNLKCLDLRCNNIEIFPEVICELMTLEILDLNSNLISDVPDAICNLINLKELYLSNNRIEYLPVTFNKLKCLEDIELTSNPLIKPPFEVACQGVRSIRNFFYELESEDDTDYLNEIKLLIVGEGRVGKTTLMNRLTNPNYKFKNENSTEGVFVKKWTISAEELDIDKNFRINVWDFGGQEIYHSTHQFFLTKRSIYLLVTESRKEDKHDDFYYWLNTIKILGDNSPVVLVLNKCDQISKEIAFKDYKKIFPNLIEYLKVGCKSKQGHTIDNLKGFVKELLFKKDLLPHIGNPLPKVWVDIRKEIEQFADKGVDYISLEKYLDICLKYKMNEERALYLSEYFHDIGVFLHFKDDIILRETIFLNHEYVTKGVYSILDSDIVINNKGVFSNKDILNIWSEKKYKHKKAELLSLMMNNKFELCFKLQKDKYLAPQLLPVDEKEFNFNNLDYLLYFEYQYTFMPKGVLARFIVKRSIDIYDSCYWRYGVVLRYNNSKAKVVEDYFNRKVIIQISGDDRKELLIIIRKTFEEIHCSFNNLEVDEMIPCNCQECKDNEEPHFYKYVVLKKYINKRKQFITCEKSLDDISVKSILNSVMTDPTKIFISYSHKDKEWMQRLQIHLKPLVRNEKIEAWDDTQIKAGDKWKDKILNKLSTANVAILLISADFLASDFIVNNELPAILKKAEYSGLKIISIILKPSLFDNTSDLSAFQTINPPSMPLSAMTEHEQEVVFMNLAKEIAEIENRE